MKVSLQGYDKKDSIAWLTTTNTDYEGSCHSKRMSYFRPPNTPCDFDAAYKLSFSGLKPKDSERAIFSFRPTSVMRRPPRDALDVLEKLRNEIRAPNPEKSSRTRRQGRLSKIESCAGIFIIQIRDGLGDCALSSLHIGPKKHRVSLAWKSLFGAFYNDKKLTKATILSHNVIMSTYRGVDIEADDI